MQDEEYINDLAYQIREIIKKDWNLSDDELDKALEEERIYMTNTGLSFPADSDILVEEEYIYVKTDKDNKS